MTRDELKALGLEDDTVNSVIALHGKSTEKLKADVATLTSEKETLVTEKETLETTLSGLDVDGLNAELEKWKIDYSTLETQKNEEVSGLIKGQAKSELINSLNANDPKLVELLVSEFAKEAEFVDGAFIGADDFKSTITENHPSLFAKAQQATGLGHTTIVPKKEMTMHEQMKQDMFGKKQ